MLHPEFGEIEVKISRRAKRISLAVLPSGAIRLIVPYGGDLDNAVAFMESRKEWILTAKEKIKCRKKEFDNRNVVVTPDTTVEDLIDMYKRAADYLPSRVDQLSKATGLNYQYMKIGRARSRWASCSGDNRLMFSIYIMALPPHLIDFIIIHELCHTQHHNHSAQFHDLVNKMTGGAEKQLEKELKMWRIY